MKCLDNLVLGHFFALDIALALPHEWHRFVRFHLTYKHVLCLSELKKRQNKSRHRPEEKVYEY